LINLNAGVTFNDAPVSSLAETRRSCPMFELGHSRPGRTSGKNGDVRYAPVATKFHTAAK
jgi:hypothetical protein